MLRHPSLARGRGRGAGGPGGADPAQRAGARGAGARVVEGAAPAALGGLPAPDAIFLGGGGADRRPRRRGRRAARPGGRLVANAVTLEMQALLMRAAERLGGALTTISIARAAPVGGMTGWRPAMPVTQWAWVKP